MTLKESIAGAAAEARMELLRILEEREHNARLDREGMCALLRLAVFAGISVSDIADQFGHKSEIIVFRWLSGAKSPPHDQDEKLVTWLHNKAKNMAVFSRQRQAAA